MSSEQETQFRQNVNAIKASSPVSDALAKRLQGKVPELSLSVMKSFEERLALGDAGILGMVAERKQELSSEMALSIPSMLRTFIREVATDKNGVNVIREADRVLIEEALKDIETSRMKEREPGTNLEKMLPFGEALSLDLKSAVNGVTPRNADSLRVALSEYLGRCIDGLEVGISYKFTDLTSTVRFGARNYYGNYMSFRSQTSDAYDRNFDSSGGSLITMNIDRETKKVMAIRLDQTHRELDLFYQRSETCGLTPQSCGSYANTFMLSNGVPLPSPSYIVPLPSILSGGVMKLLRLPLIKNFKFKLPEGNSMAILPVIVNHDVMLPLNEMSLLWTTAFASPFAGAVLGPLVGKIYHLASEQSWKVDVELTEDPVIEGERCAKGNTASCCKLRGAALMSYRALSYCRCPDRKTFPATPESPSCG